MIIIGFILCQDLSQNPAFAQDLVPIVDTNKSLGDYIRSLVVHSVLELDGVQEHPTHPSTVKIFVMKYCGGWTYQ